MSNATHAIRFASVLAVLLSTSCGGGSWRTDLGEASRRGTYLLDCNDTDVITAWMGGRFFESTGCGRWVAIECTKRECRTAAEPRDASGDGPHRQTVERARRVRAALVARTDEFLECTEGQPFFVTFHVNDNGYVTGVSGPRNYEGCIRDHLESAALPAGRGRLQIRHEFRRAPTAAPAPLTR